MKKKQKHVPGPEVSDIQHFLELFIRREPVYYRHKFTSFGWYQNWTLRTIQDAVNKGYIKLVGELK